jgi:hypothetical protein
LNVLFDLDQFGGPLGRLAHDFHALAKAWWQPKQPGLIPNLDRPRCFD